MHALDRINERYGNIFTINDINKISVLIKKGLCLEIVKDFVDRDRITVLIRYNNIPLKTIYSKATKRVLTVLPLDVDEYNEYCRLVPEITTDRAFSLNFENEAFIFKKILKKNSRIKNLIAGLIWKTKLGMG